ncbi:MAG: DNA mismatch repair endonuclease MutL [Holophagaceae bacterium]|nr:DNA mismatch repair endonuclease MutL [Holophagaceae bacterium]
MSNSPRIRVLSDQVVNQIAAGEVVERPASILKELVENSLDAGATSLDIAWEEGGRKFLEVADNGCGMARDDLYMALERHATSKIISSQDLQALGSFGFRGEALPSIASVTRFEINSAQSDGLGYILRSDFGVIKGVTPAPRAKGTTVSIRDIFLQLPARRRFLKSAETEHAHLWSTITRMALATPSTQWRIRSDRSGELILPVVTDLRHRIAPLLGEKTSKLATFSDGAPPWKLHGFISPPDLSYRNRNHLYLFVNGRPVRDRLILSALATGWEGFFPKGAYPVVVLFLEVPPEAVDVNVHPTKAEVRFHQPQRIFPWISSATREAWGAIKTELPSVSGLPPRQTNKGFDRPKQSPFAAPEHPQLWANSKEVLKSLQQAFSSSLDSPYSAISTETRAAEASLSNYFSAMTIRYLGSFSNTYLLAEVRMNNQPELWIVDQHVAHERVLYEQLFIRKTQPAIQPFLPPKVIHIGHAMMAKLSPYIGELCSIGVEVEPMGEDAIAVRALPDFLVDRSPDLLLEDLVKRIESNKGNDLEYFRKDLNAELACRSAIKKNHALDSVQAQALLDSLVNCDNPLTCPHGRPVMKKMTLVELERSFGRRS